MIQVDEWSFRCSKCDWTPDRTSKVHPGTQTRWHIDGHQSDCLTCEELRAELLALRQQLGQAETKQDVRWCVFDSIEGVAYCGGHLQPLEHQDDGWLCRIGRVKFEFGCQFGQASKSSPTPAARLPRETPQEPLAVSVEGVYMDRSIKDFQRACAVHIEEEQRKPSPDSALIGLLCDAVRCSRELSLTSAAALLPAPQSETCGLLSGFGSYEHYACRLNKGHDGPHRNRNGYEWTVPAPHGCPPEKL